MPAQLAAPVPPKLPPQNIPQMPGNWPGPQTQPFMPPQMNTPQIQAQQYTPPGGVYRPEQGGYVPGGSMPPQQLPPVNLPAQGPCLLYTSPSPRDRTRSRMPSSA